jgi:hypothetical protein
MICGVHVRWLLTSVRHSEALYEDESFPERELAALVAAKVYYQLQEYNESMVFALGAGKLFDIHKAAEFEETIMGKTYTNTRDGLRVSRTCLRSPSRLIRPVLAADTSMQRNV